MNGNRWTSSEHAKLIVALVQYGQEHTKWKLIEESNILPGRTASMIKNKAETLCRCQLSEILHFLRHADISVALANEEVNNFVHDAVAAMVGQDD